MAAFFELLLFAAVALTVIVFGKKAGKGESTSHAPHTITIRCPNCGSPADLRGDHWECPYCGDSGSR